MNGVWTTFCRRRVPGAYRRLSSRLSEGASARFGPSCGHEHLLIVALPNRARKLVKKMRIAATADLHFSPQSYAKLKDQFERVRDEADVFVIAGDLTNYGEPAEMEPLLNVLVRLRLPIVAVLGNHDYECGKEEELKRMMVNEGI